MSRTSSIISSGSLSWRHSSRDRLRADGSSAGRRIVICDIIHLKINCIKLGLDCVHDCIYSNVRTKAYRYNKSIK